MEVGSFMTKLLSISTENYRQFQGNYTIDFSTSATSDVTLVRADNGGGKTTLVEAVHWALYGKVLALPQRGQLLNWAAERNGKRGVTVAILLQDHGIEYRVHRALKSKTQTSDVKVESLSGTFYRAVDCPTSFLSAFNSRVTFRFFQPISSRQEKLDLITLLSYEGVPERTVDSLVKHLPGDAASVASRALSLLPYGAAGSEWNLCSLVFELLRASNERSGGPLLLDQGNFGHMDEPYKSSARRVVDAIGRYRQVILFESPGNLDPLGGWKVLDLPS